METATISQPMAAIAQAVNSAAQSGAAQGTLGISDISGGGAFMQLLQQLLGQAVGEQTQTEDAEEQGTQLASDLFAQLFSGVLFGNTDLSTQVGATPADAAQLGIQADMLQTDPLALLQTLFTAVNAQKEDGNQQNLTELFQVPLQNGNDLELSQAGQMVAQVIDNSGGTESNSLLNGESTFRNSILEAQKLLRGGKTQQREQTRLDVDQLQQDVNSGKFNSLGTTERVFTDPHVDANNVMEQVKSGIKENLTQGNNEFVIKLKPDGLGEITVKMVESSDSKISLSIVTSSQQVAKLINGELTGLRETLRPFNADVHEVVSQTDASYTAAQNGQFAQQDSGRHFQQYSHSSQGSDFSELEEEEFELGLPAMSTAPTSELDTYI